MTRATEVETQVTGLLPEGLAVGEGTVGTQISGSQEQGEPSAHGPCCSSGVHSPAWEAARRLMLPYCDDKALDIDFRRTARVRDIVLKLPHRSASIKIGRFCFRLGFLNRLAHTFRTTLSKRTFDRSPTKFKAYLDGSSNGARPVLSDCTRIIKYGALGVDESLVSI